MINWPDKHDIFGVHVSATTYEQLVPRLIDAAKGRQSAIADFMPVHGLVTAATETPFRRMINQFDVVAPDGQPVRWALNYFHKTGLDDRVYGPELTWRICRAAAEEGVGLFLYGATPEVVQALIKRLREEFPAINIAGWRSPPFRPLTPEEDAAYTQEINDSGAGIVLLGIGCPRQEVFAFEHRDRINAVQLCVGAAFDFHAGNKKKAPSWMQKRGLEWLFRLTQEPGRLWKRYLVYNSLYCWLFATHALRRRSPDKPHPTAGEAG